VARESGGPGAGYRDELAPAAGLFLAYMSQWT